MYTRCLAPTGEPVRLDKLDEIKSNLNLKQSNREPYFKKQSKTKYLVRKPSYRFLAQPDNCQVYFYMYSCAFATSNFIFRILRIASNHHRLLSFKVSPGTQL